MTDSERYEYASRWQYHQREVMKAFSAAIEILFEFKVYEDHFNEDIKTLMDNNVTAAGNIILDVHELFELQMPFPLEETFQIFDTLYDAVLMISSELVDHELGYRIAIRAVEMS